MKRARARKSSRKRKPTTLSLSLSLTGGYVLHHDFQLLVLVDQQRPHHPLDELRLPVEDVHLGVRDLPVDHQGHSQLLHRPQRRIEPGQVGDARVGVGGRARRVELVPVDGLPPGRRLPHVLRGRPVRQVQGHPGPEAVRRRRGARSRGRGDRSLYPGKVGERALDAGDGGDEVGHDDRPSEDGGGGGDDGAERPGAVADVEVPVVGAGDGEGGEGGGSGGRRGRGHRCRRRRRSPRSQREGIGRFWEPDGADCCLGGRSSSRAHR